MNREEFVTELRTTLSGRVPSTVIEDNADYYEEYIIAQIRQGKTEEEVTGTLGSPRLLAKTIIEANKHAEQGNYASEEDEYRTTGAADENRYTAHPILSWYAALPKWVHTVVYVLAAALLIYVVAAMISVMLPVILLGLVIWLVARSIRNWTA